LSERPPARVYQFQEFDHPVAADERAQLITASLSHPRNGPPSILETFKGITTDITEQFSNALSPMVVRVSGSTILSKETHPEKASCPMEMVDGANLTDSNNKQLKNTDAPMFIILEGSATVFIEVPAKAPLPIDNILSGNTTKSIDVQPENARIPIEVIPLGKLPNTRLRQPVNISKW